MLLEALYYEVCSGLHLGDGDETARWTRGACGYDYSLKALSDGGGVGGLNAVATDELKPLTAVFSLCEFCVRECTRVSGQT